MTANQFLQVDEAVALALENLVDDVAVFEQFIYGAALIVQGTEVNCTTHSLLNV